MRLYFQAISEATPPGPKWQQLFHQFWIAYRAWLNDKRAAGYKPPGRRTARAALKAYMPEMLPAYERCCELAGADEVVERFLTGYRPPPFISGCSQAVLARSEVQLARNYDFHPRLTEGTLLLSAWNGRKVMANSDCLIGVLDGMNDDGLAVSLSFGGRRVVGKGFGIPFILRYVLECCSDVPEAVEALTAVPSHMSYSVTVVDRHGAFKTVLLAPDRAPRVTDAAFCTNHQGLVEWKENAAFNRTLERFAFLKQLFEKPDLDADALTGAFLRPPLYNTNFTEGFGTLYTAVYHPAEGTMQLRWPNGAMRQTFDDFREERMVVKLL